jgi:hypothetical protein
MMCYVTRLTIRGLSAFKQDSGASGSVYIVGFFPRHGIRDGVDRSMYANVELVALTGIEPVFED